MTKLEYPKAEGIVSRVCTRCNKEKPLKCFYRSRVGKHGRKPMCIPCVLAYNKEWKANHREAYRGQDQKSKSRHREKCPDRQRARELLTYAHKMGLKLRYCDWPGCNSIEKIQGAHPSYSQPTLIHQLCFKHHKEFDRRGNTTTFNLPVIDFSKFLSDKQLNSIGGV